MNEVYFDLWKYRKAISLINNDPLWAKKLLEEYIFEYPKDYNGHTYYVYCLIVLNEIDSAANYIMELEAKAKNDKNFKEETGKYNKFKNLLLTNKIKVMAANENYKELYELITEYPYKLDNSIRSLLLQCKTKLGIIDKSEIKNKMSYIERQIINYSKEEFKNHVEKHLADYNIDTDNQNNNIFSVDFDLDEILKEIKKYIPSDKKLLSTVISDFYVFKYDNCGRDKGKITDYFKVICLHNTQDIITMCPVSDIENMPYVDINYLTDARETNLPSQIEKFNKRYRKMKPKISKINVSEQK